MFISLNNNSWKVKGFWPYVPLLHKGMELGNEMMGVTDWLDATVPGGVHFDLWRAGIIEDPYYEQNSLKCEWVEHRWWMYRTVFSIEEDLLGRHYTLIFKGVDYKAHFYLNGQKLGTHEGMYEPAAFQIDDILRVHDENELIVLLEHAPWEVPQIGYTSQTRTQKSRFNYKWDFGTRLVNIGLWDDVLLHVTGDLIIDEVFIHTDTEGGDGIISVSATVKGIANIEGKVRVHVHHNDEKIACWEKGLIVSRDFTDISTTFRIPNPKLWYPNGLGEQPLYRIIIEVYDKNGQSDQREYYTGIRKLEYRRNQGSPLNAYPYTFVVNGNPVYIKGVNLTPFDHLYGNVTKDTYEKYMALLKKANVNMVRIWGGGIIEKEYFYHLCDSNGIMVWQEFIQSSSGIDNIPSTDPHFLQLLKRTALWAVKEKRNHVCHTVWSGGNELMDRNNVPITSEHPNIRMLKDIVRELDPDKLFLPSSASGPNEFLNCDQPGMNHDVHGNWKYEGVQEHYRKYNKSDSLFHSEFGVDGCSSMAAIQRFMGPEHWKVTNMTENLVWRHHGEWWDTQHRDEGLFGKFKHPEDFIRASQFVQAEGLRYIVESNRRRKFQNSGSIIWQFNEPWPNVSCTSLVEYQGRPKMAYYWVRNAYAPVHASMAYEKLIWKANEEFTGSIFLHNSLWEKVLTINWELLDVYGNVLVNERKTENAPQNCAKKVGKLSCIIPELDLGIFFVRLTVTNNDDEKVDENVYVFSQMETHPFAALLYMGNGKYSVKKVQDGFRIRNTGGIVIPFLHGLEEGSAQVFIEDNYFTLFPGEEKHCIIKWTDSNNAGPHTEGVSIAWNSFRGLRDAAEGL